MTCGRLLCEHARMAALQAVLMDFGSARPAHVTVRNRTEALMLQEDAEKLCTAPYRYRA